MALPAGNYDAGTITLLERACSALRVGTLRFAIGESANHGVDLKTENREECVLFGPSAEIRAAAFVATSSCFFNRRTVQHIFDVAESSAVTEVAPFAYPI